jgi:hypothetical protein
MHLQQGWRKLVARAPAQAQRPRPKQKADLDMPEIGAVRHFQFHECTDLDAGVKGRNDHVW